MLSYRVFIKYCVFFLKILWFFLTLPVLLQRWCYTCPVCVHTLTLRENRERPESGIYFKINENTQYLMNILQLTVVTDGRTFVFCGGGGGSRYTAWAGIDVTFLPRYLINDIFHSLYIIIYEDIYIYTYITLSNFLSFCIYRLIKGWRALYVLLYILSVSQYIHVAKRDLKTIHELHDRVSHNS